MSESEDQASHDQSDDSTEQRDPSREDGKQQEQETLTPAEIARLRKEASDARNEAAARRVELRDLKAAQSKADQEKAKEQGDFEKLYQQEQSTTATLSARVAELEGQIKTAERSTLRAQVAQKYKLPAELTDLLQGDDESALDASAKRLAKHVRTDAPDTEAGVNRSRQQPARPERKPEPGKTVDGVQTVAWPT